MALRKLGPLMAVCILALATAAGAQNSLDPFFSTVPFGEWVKSPGAGQIPLKVSADPPMLDDFQRLQLTMNISVDGRDVAKRPPKGHLQFFLQFGDAARNVYQGHGEFDLKEMKPNIKQADVVYAQAILVMPGEYLAAMAVYDDETREYGIVRKTVRVPAMKDDPLPVAWRNMPPVEFVTSTERPDVWFQPDLTGRLFLPLALRTPARIDLLMILPGEMGSTERQNRMRGRLVASLKDLSQVDAMGSSVSAAVLDLTRRRVAFTQDLGSPATLDWPKLADAFGEANPGTIDVGSLANRGKGVEFFENEIGRRLQSSEKSAPRHIVIILAAPMQFPEGTEIHPIQLDEPATAELYYLRIHGGPAPRPAIMPPSQRGGGRRGGGSPTGGGRFPPDEMRLGRLREGDDSLEATLKPLNPHLFDIHGAEDFRKALAAMLTEIAKR